MYTESIGTNNVPAFLSKLWRLVDSSHNNDLISWSPSGKSFIIRNQAKFAKELLPLYFKHNNMASFIRQLNMYGFRKITHIENSGLKVENDEIEFYHSCFVKGQENMLEYIKRKNSLSVANAKSNGALEDKTNKEEVHTILTDVRGIKTKQDNMDSLLTKMQNENEALWKEIANLRHKHQKQQQIVERLIHFLMSLVHSGGIGMKSKLPLMIYNRNCNKTVDQSGTSNFLIPSSGPIIQEITHGLLDEEYDDMNNGNSPITNSAISESSEPVQQFEETDDSPIFVNQQDQLTASNTLAIENEFKESNSPSSGASLLDPLQESINAINADGDQIIDLDAVGAIPIEGENLQQTNVQLNDKNYQTQQSFVGKLQPQQVTTTLSAKNLMNSVNQSSNNLNLVMPQNTLNKDSFCNSTNNNLVPSTSSFDTNVLNTPNITVSQLFNSNTSRDNFNDHFGNHCEGVDSELSSLQDQLLQGNFNIDSNVLMGVRMDSKYIDELFSHDDSTNKAVQINDTATSSLSDINSINTPLSTPKPVIQSQTDAVDQDITNSNFELCDNLFDNQSDFLTGGTSLNNKDLNDTNFGTSVDGTGIFDADDLLNTEAEINQLLNQANDDQDMFNKDRKRRRVI